MPNKRVRQLSILIFLFMVTSCQTEPQIPVQVAEVDFLPNGHPVDMVFNPVTGYMYITNDFGNYIGVFEGTGQIAGIKAQGEDPKHLAVDEASGWVYVVNERSNTVSIIQDIEIVATVEIEGRMPRDVVVEPQNGWAYVVAGHSKKPPADDAIEIGGFVTVLKGERIIGTISLGPVQTAHVVADPVNGLVYVGSVGLTGGGQVFVLDGLDVINRFNVKLSIETMGVNPNTGDVYVLNTAADRNLTHFRNGEFISAIGFGEDGRGLGSLRNMIVHPTTGEVYVLDFVAHEVLVVDNMKIKARAPVGLGALKMAADPYTGNVYVANFREDTVTVINGRKTITTLDVGWYPYGIGVNPTNGWVYVSNTNEDTVTVFGIEDN